LSANVSFVAAAASTSGALPQHHANTVASPSLLHCAWGVAEAFLRPSGSGKLAFPRVPLVTTHAKIDEISEPWQAQLRPNTASAGVARGRGHEPVDDSASR